MNMKKAIAAVLVVGTMTMAGAAFAGPRFHDRHGRGGFEPRQWEHQERHGGNNGSRHVEIDKHHRPVGGEQGSWNRPDKGMKGKKPVFTPKGGGRGPRPGGHSGGFGSRLPKPGMGGHGPRTHGWR